MVLVSWQWKERGYLVQHVSIFTWRNDLRQNPAKHSSVVNVRWNKCIRDPHQCQANGPGKRM